MKINKNLFSQIAFFLSGITEVNSLELGAKENGGATKLQNGIYSNIEENDYIKVNNDKNILSVFLPSTLNADINIDNNSYIKKYYNMIESNYKDTITVLKTKGSWYSEDLNKVIIEDITILSLNAKEITQQDINFFLNLGLQVKEDMGQESVSVSINGSLALV